MERKKNNFYHSRPKRFFFELIELASTVSWLFLAFAISLTLCILQWYRDIQNNAILIYSVVPYIMIEIGIAIPPQRESKIVRKETTGKMIISHICWFLFTIFSVKYSYAYTKYIYRKKEKKRKIIYSAGNNFELICTLMCMGVHGQFATQNIYKKT